ncbi:protein transport protein bet1 [Physocladia obscura]|uniref:Protein transport protein bet1 n=1 Tax=Physocladia obscura TaxID=109957 RepID=A0AAD5T9Y2_9FUNG|nr:protein transport protein bet1 [Physocladia obscura]
MSAYRRPVGNTNSNANNNSPFASAHYASSSSSTPSPSLSSASQSHSAFMTQNDEHADLLAAKVAMLKEISVQIGDEVSYQKDLLKGMTDDFDNTGNILSATIKRVALVARSPNGRWMCWLMAFVVAVLFYIVFLSRKFK